MAALQMQRFDEAERLAEAVFKSNRNNAVAAAVLGRALMMQNRAAEAIVPLQRAMRRADDPALETLLAGALRAAGRGEEALEQLRQTTARRPPFLPAFLERGRQLADAGRHDEAIAMLEGALELAPESIEMHLDLAFILQQRNARGRARAVLLRAQALAPQRLDVLASLAQIMILDGEYAAAADTYRRVLALQPGDAAARFELGRCLLELGEREAGEASLREAVRSNPQLASRLVVSLAAASRGRFFLRPSTVANFMMR
jgi:tetratricopeptide (TPR) repeat protein